MADINAVNNRFLNQPVTPIAANYTALISDVIIEVTSTAAARTITLPAPVATGNVGKAFVIKDTSGGANTNNITVIPASGLIDGVASVSIGANYGSLSVYCDGAAYYTYGAPLLGNGIYKINKQVFASNGTYTPSPGMVYCEVEMVGGGGAGGGGSATGASQVSAGAGGGGGEYAVGIFSSAQIGGSQTVTIGTGGSGNSGGVGGNGATTSFGSLMTAFGGSGGATTGLIPNPGAGYTVGTLGGTGGTGGSYRSAGYPGGGAWAVANPYPTIIAGLGGSSPLGAGGVSFSGGSAAGYGAGGGGIGVGGSSSAGSGGAGSPGAVFITEYIGGSLIPLWTPVSGTAQTLAQIGDYYTLNSALTTLTLPVSAAVGTQIQIAGVGAGGWKIAQNAGQSINIGNQATTAGAGGSISSTNQYDGITLLCVGANTQWVGLGAVGNLTVV